MNRWRWAALAVLVVGLAVSFLVVPYGSGDCDTASDCGPGAVTLFGLGTPTTSAIASSGVAGRSQTPFHGQLAFDARKHGNRDVYLMDAAGSVRRITSSPAAETDPALSPDGRSIVYVSSAGPGGSDIWLASVNGEGRHRLTHDEGHEATPAWSPDGRRIAFACQSGSHQDICVIRKDGSRERRLTDDAAPDLGPSWSPSGLRILFQTYRMGQWAIYEMRASGSNLHSLLLVRGHEIRSPAWSPSGAWIAFTMNITGKPGFEIYEIRPSGVGRRRLTRDRRTDMDPAWSPSGHAIIYASMNTQSLYSKLIIMRNHQTKVAVGGHQVGSPSWSN